MKLCSSSHPTSFLWHKNPWSSERIQFIGHSLLHILKTKVDVESGLKKILRSKLTINLVIQALASRL